MISGSMNEFDEILFNHLIPEYQSLGYLKGIDAVFNDKERHFSDADASYFVEAFKNGLINHVGRSRYKAPMSGATEGFFNSGPSTESPRTFYLAQEVIITVGVLARLHLDYGWPKELLGAQSKDWAFDAVAFMPNSVTEHIACEVKKTASEVDKLLMFVNEICDADVMLSDSESRLLRPDKLNAYRKVRSLLRNKVPIFWAVGPDGFGQVFEMEYPTEGRVKLNRSDQAVLRYTR
jgi:hypothetical protein